MEGFWRLLENPQMKINNTIMKKNIFYLLLLSITILVPMAIGIVSCDQEKEGTFISVKNNLHIDRSYETVELTKTLLKMKELNGIGVRDVETGEVLVTQEIDSDENGFVDLLLFQPKIGAFSQKKYELIILNDSNRSMAEDYCYSRFVPERMDDYAWENDKVAFRVFGPAAQKLSEAGDKSGTLSSGIDVWLKKVDYPIIDKWYKKTIEGTGSYHEDTGEGLDNFHVGPSRGVGGIAIKNNENYYYSKNYTNWHTITKGPIRTSFYIDYDLWNVNGKKIQESRIISLDLGSYLSKFEVSIMGSDHISAGLTMHEKDGDVVIGSNSWAGYWQPHGDSELGSAIVAPSKYFSGIDNYQTEEKDLSNLFVKLKVVDNKVTYYAGFSWKERGDFTNPQEWHQYLTEFSNKLKNPLEVSLVE
jgi:hypothetical protein